MQTTTHNSETGTDKVSRLSTRSIENLGKNAPMNYLKTKWIQRLIENDFVEVKPTKTWRPKYRIFINSYLAGHAVVVEPEHPHFTSWKDIQKHIKGQIK